MPASAASDVSRRRLVQGTLASGVGAALITATGPTAPAAQAAEPHAPARGRRDGRGAGDHVFTVAVMPDTQYLFDGTSIRTAPVQAAIDYIKHHRRDENIVFLGHLGDLTQNGTASEMAAFASVFRTADRTGVPWSALAGNHDVDSKTDDTRGRTPYLDRMRRRVGEKGVLAVSPDGYSSAHDFRAGGREWMVLSLDWRLSEKGFAWAERILATYRNRPTILLTHELVKAPAEGSGAGLLSEYGAQVWNRLIRAHDQVFLGIGGHYWPTGRLVRTNAAGHEVQLHLANYQEKYYGGGGMIRTYRFDLERGVVDVETFSPWVQGTPAAKRNELMNEELVISGPNDAFTFPLDAVSRFAGFSAEPVRPSRPARAVLVKDTVAYWRWDGIEAGSVLGVGTRVRDLSGRGNHLQVVRHGAARLRVESAFHPDQPGHASLTLKAGDHLATVDKAPLVTATFEKGYTFEAFFHLPPRWTGDNAWSALLSREGQSKDTGATGGDPEEPPVTLSLSGSRELQWAVYPTQMAGGKREGLTNWGHELRLDRWWHVAVVNDGRETTMYVDGCEVARNPEVANRGLAGAGGRWLLGGYQYGGKLDKVFTGQIGDVRIVERALKPSEFMNA